MPTTSALAHRRLLDGPADFRPFAGTDLLARIGGQSTVDTLVDRLYDAFESDPVIRPLFPRDLTAGRAGSKVFFVDWLGGERRYSDRSHSALRHRHDDVPISRAQAGRWLGHFRRALDNVVPAEADRAAIFAQAKTLAYGLVNASEPGGSPVAACGVGARTLKSAADLARRGDAGGLDAVVAQAPDLTLASYGAQLLQVATLAGRVDIVRLLLEHGIGPNAPHYLPVGVVGRAFERVLFVTPLCAARVKRRAAVESALLQADAKEDVFTSAFLGDVVRLAGQLAADPELARAYDPAADILDVTPVEHAIAGGQVEALRILLRHGQSVRVDWARPLRGAAEKNSLPMVQLLLDSGADATRIGPGRWVLHPEIAPLLAARGGSIDSSGSWIGLCCTGNQGRKDDPEYVRALIRHGARADDRRTGDRPGETLAATGLHYAAKAGFVRTIEVLLEYGADPAATDSLGRTPLDWLENAASRVDREAVRRRLPPSRS
jgi:truncated hemoglobin YjbI/ankyrin repeat protein